LRIFAKCDEVMSRVMTKLGLSIPEFRLNRRFRVRIDLPSKETASFDLVVEGIDEAENHFTMFEKVQFKGEKNDKMMESKIEPHKFGLKSIPASSTLKLFFAGHYEEPPLEVELNDVDELALKPRRYIMVFNPFDKFWELCIAEE
jgi:hypothetical protein